jgi:hypothetical protein
MATGLDNFPAQHIECSIQIEGLFGYRVIEQTDALRGTLDKRAPAVDCAQEAFGGCEDSGAQLLPSIAAWVKRLAGALELSEPSQ